MLNSWVFDFTRVGALEFSLLSGVRLCLKVWIAPVRLHLLIRYANNYYYCNWNRKRRKRWYLKKKKRRIEIAIVMMAHCCIDKRVFQVYRWWKNRNLTVDRWARTTAASWPRTWYRRTRPISANKSTRCCTKNCPGSPGPDRSSCPCRKRSTSPGTSMTVCTWLVMLYSRVRDWK